MDAKAKSTVKNMFIPVFRIANAFVTYHLVLLTSSDRYSSVGIVMDSMV